MVNRIISISIALLLATSPAFAEHVILTAFDDSPPTNDCARVDGSTDTPTVCYLPNYGPNANTLSAWAQAHQGAFPPITVTLAQPTLIDIHYRQIAFLNNNIPSGCTSGMPSCGALYIGIGVGGNTPNDVCGEADIPGVQAGLIDAVGQDFLSAMARTAEAECIVTLPAGTTLIYAMESARNGAFIFNGPGEQLLKVEFDR